MDRERERKALLLAAAACVALLALGALLRRASRVRMRRAGVVS